MTRKLIALLVCAVVVLAVPAHTEAQGIKGLIKKKVTSEAKGEEKAADKSKSGQPKAGPQFGGDLIEITAPVAEDFITARRLQVRLMKELRKELVAYKTPEQYRACGQQVAASPEMQKIIMSLANVPENASEAVMKRAMEKMNADMVALNKAKCGGNIDEDWPQYKRAARVAAIQEEAATAFDAALAARAAGTHGPAVGESIWEYAVEPSRKYSLAEERIDAFCEARSHGPLERDPRGFYFVKGSGQGMYFLYSDAEHDSITKICEQRDLMLASQDQKLLDLLHIQQ
jgi:hypothetical protein